MTGDRFRDDLDSWSPFPNQTGCLAVIVGAVIAGAVAGILLWRGW